MPTLEKIPYVRAIADVTTSRSLNRVPLRSALQAAERSQENAMEIKMLHAQAARAGWSMPLDRVLSLYEVDAGLKNWADTTGRWAWKACAARLGILE